MTSRSRSSSWMLRACAHGDLYTIESLLATRGKTMLSVHGADGCTPLLVAAKRGHQHIVSFLLDAGVTIDQTDLDSKRQGNVLHYACWGGHVDLVRWLIDVKACDPGHTDVVGNTPLLYAVYGGHRVVVEELLRRGRSLRERNNKHHSAILQAACGGHLDIVQWLLEEGFTLRETDLDGNTPLLFAAWGGHGALMEFLLAKGSNLSEKNTNGHSVFLSAANGGRVEIVEGLLAKGFSLKETNSNMDTALLLASYGGHIHLVDRLLQLGASLEERNVCGFTPLLSAANGGQLEMAEWLLSRGASIHEKDNDGYSSLILAACGGNVQLVRYFLEKGASLSERNNNGDSCLLLAAYCGHTQLVEWLLANGSSVDERNSTGMGVMISAANGGHLETVKSLLTFVGASGLEETDEGGYTPILLAAQRGHLDVVKFLATQGANIHARTSRHDNDAVALAMDFPAVQEYLRYVWEMKPLQIATDARDVDRVHEMLQCGLDPQRGFEESEMPLAIAQRVGTYDNAPSVDPDLVRLLTAATKPWSPQRHMLFGSTFRRAIVYMLWLKKQLDAHPVLPYLPPEIWRHVMALMQRSWFQDQGVQGDVAPIIPRRRKSRTSWRRHFLSPGPLSSPTRFTFVSPAQSTPRSSFTFDFESDDESSMDFSACNSPLDEPLQLAENDAQGRMTPRFVDQDMMDLAHFSKAIEADDSGIADDVPLHVRITWV